MVLVGLQQPHHAESLTLVITSLVFFQFDVERRTKRISRVLFRTETVSGASIWRMRPSFKNNRISSCFGRGWILIQPPLLTSYQNGRLMDNFS